MKKPIEQWNPPLKAQDRLLMPQQPPYILPTTWLGKESLLSTLLPTKTSDTITTQTPFGAPKHNSGPSKFFTPNKTVTIPFSQTPNSFGLSCSSCKDLHHHIPKQLLIPLPKQPLTSPTKDIFFKPVGHGKISGDCTTPNICTKNKFTALEVDQLLSHQVKAPILNPF